MTAYITALLLLALALLMLLAKRAYYYFPARELKRQARAGDREAATLYRAVAYGDSLRLLLWTAAGLCTAASFTLLSAVAPAWLAFLAVASLIWYFFAWIPNSRVGSVGARLAVVLAPMLARVLYYAHPLLDGTARFIKQHRPTAHRTGLYEPDDLTELLKDQKQMSGSRIPLADLDRAMHALNFSGKTIQGSMIPKRDTITVQDSDVIGPILMDELYDSKHSRFPVVAADDGEVVGVLYLRDLISAKQGGSVRDVMKREITYVHEDQTLHQALHAFLTTRQQLFVVVDSDAAYVGIMTIDDVLEQVMGHRIEGDFDSYDDKRAVAAAGRAPHAVQGEQSDDVETELSLDGVADA